MEQTGFFSRQLDPMGRRRFLIKGVTLSEAKGLLTAFSKGESFKKSFGDIVNHDDYVQKNVKLRGTRVGVWFEAPSALAQCLYQVFANIRITRKEGGAKTEAMLNLSWQRR
jgi:hypothetical protein